MRSGWELPNCAPVGLLLTLLRGDFQPWMNLTGSGHAQKDRPVQPVEGLLTPPLQLEGVFSLSGRAKE